MTVLNMSSPGAPRCTVFLPKLENDDRASFAFVPAVLHNHDVIQTVECVRSRALPRGVHESATEYLRRPINADDANRVVARSADSPRNMAAVSVEIFRVHSVNAAEHVHTKAVVHESVPVVVDPVAVAVRVVAKHVRREIRMPTIDSGVDDRNYDVGAAFGQVPSLLRADVGAWRAPCLA